jgi:orotate phosphoribosyltransferase-like protein
MQGGARIGAGRKPAMFDHKRALSLRQQGFTYIEIANRFGVSKDAIKYFFSKHNEKTALTQNQKDFA